MPKLLPKFVIAVTRVVAFKVSGQDAVRPEFEVAEVRVAPLPQGSEVRWVINPSSGLPGEYLLSRGEYNKA